MAGYVSGIIACIMSQPFEYIRN